MVSTLSKLANITKKPRVELIQILGVMGVDAVDHDSDEQDDFLRSSPFSGGTENTEIEEFSRDKDSPRDIEL
ncbi:hypothetical protein CI610_00486 [invertebrate metagenome]|uniref:Uncharacterized protein n=1 Tax=invertebrate metagenome TaxID=1711999 RepID=A0A2H9TBL8_9ZZZZ